MAEIVHFVHALNGRAIAEVATCLAAQMQAQGRSSVVVASTVWSGVAEPAGVQVIDLGGSGHRTLPVVGALARVLRQVGPTTVFAHAEGPTRTALAATRLIRPRPTVIGIIHNHYSSYAWSQRRVRRVIDGLVLPWADALVGVSPGVAEDIAATFPTAARKVEMIPPPLTRWHALAELAAQPVHHPWLDGSRRVVVTVGHVHLRKDHETLVRAVAELRARGADVPRVLIIGSDTGEHANRVRALISELDLAQDVALLGALDNPMPYVAAADLFVLSSRNEGMPVSLLEAMAVGTPIVSTDAPSGPRWALEEGQGGLVTPVGDVPSLATAIDRLLGDPALRERVVSSSRRRAEAFAPASIAEAHLALADRLR